MKLYYECFHLFIGDMEEFLYGIQKRLKDQKKRLIVTDLSHCCGQDPKQLSDGTIIRIGLLGYTQNHIADCNNRQMAGKSIKGQTVALFGQLQILLTGFE